MDVYIKARTCVQRRQQTPQHNPYYHTHEQSSCTNMGISSTNKSLYERRTYVVAYELHTSHGSTFNAGQTTFERRDFAHVRMCVRMMYTGTAEYESLPSAHASTHALADARYVCVCGVFLLCVVSFCCCCCWCACVRVRTISSAYNRINCVYVCMRVCSTYSRRAAHIEYSGKLSFTTPHPIHYGLDCM